MKNMWRNPARFWLMNTLLTFGLAVVHFSLYIALREMVHATGDGGRTFPAWFVVALGLPVMSVGGYLLAHPAPWMGSPPSAHNGMGFVYFLAGVNALLFGAWTTVQARIVPGIVRIAHRAVTESLVKHKTARRFR